MKITTATITKTSLSFQNYFRNWVQNPNISYVITFGALCQKWDGRPNVYVLLYHNVIQLQIKFVILEIEELSLNIE